MTGCKCFSFLELSLSEHLLILYTAQDFPHRIKHTGPRGGVSILGVSLMSASQAGKPKDFFLISLGPGPGEMDPTN